MNQVDISELKQLYWMRRQWICLQMTSSQKRTNCEYLTCVKGQEFNISVNYYVQDRTYFVYSIKLESNKCWQLVSDNFDKFNRRNKFVKAICLICCWYFVSQLYNSLRVAWHVLVCFQYCVLYIISMSKPVYDLVAQYDTMEGYSQDGTKVINMFRTYEEEDLRWEVW